MNIEIGDKFQIKNNVYKGKTFTCVAINENHSYAFQCECGDGVVYYFSLKNLEYYGSAVKVLYSNRAPRLEEAKAKVAEILSSPYVSSVEVNLEESFANKRIYSAISRDKGIPHLYRIRVEDTFDGCQVITTAKCNCLGFSKHSICRHVERLAEVDAANCNREIYPFEIANYTAHKRAA